MEASPTLIPGLRSDSRLGQMLSGRLVRSVAVVGMGHAGAYALMLLATPLLTRLYQPEHFGLLATYGSLMSFIGTVICLRYEAAIPTPKSGRRARSLVVIAMTCAVFASAASWLLLSVAVPLLPASLQQLEPFLGVLALNFLTYGGFQIVTFWATREQQFGRLAQLRMFLVAGTVVGQIGFFLAGFTVSGLLYGQAVGYFLATMLSIWRYPPQGRWMQNPLLHRVTASRFWRFPTFGVPSESLHIAQTTTPPLLLMAFYGPVPAGWFLLAWRVVGAPLTMLVVPIGRVYYAEAARIGPKQPEQLESFFWRTLKKSFIVAAPAIGGTALVAPIAFPFFLGEAWRESGFYCQILCPLLFAHLFAVAVRQTYEVTSRQDLQLLSSTIGSGLMLVAFFAAYGIQLATVNSMVEADSTSTATTLSAAPAIIALSVAGCLSHFCSVMLCWYSIRHPRQKPPKEFSQ